MAVQNGVARDDYGNVLAGASITVYDTGTSTLSTLYEDSDLAVATPNPISADDIGEFTIYIEPGSYDLVIAKAGFAADSIDEVEITGLASIGSRGELYISSSGATAVTTAFTTVLATTFADGELHNFTRADGVLTYTGPDTTNFLVTVVYSITSDTNNVVTELAMRKNGASEVAKSLILRKVGTGADVGAAALCSIIEMTTGDTLEIVTRIQAATANLTLEAMNFSMVG